MTLLNHIGVFVFILFVMILAAFPTYYVSEIGSSLLKNIIYSIKMAIITFISIELIGWILHLILKVFFP